MKELDEIKDIFLSDVDEETRQDNLQRITEWEQGLIENQNLASWQEHDITKKILTQVKQSWLDYSLLLANNRTLTEQQRMSLWAKQDACLWIISLGSKDAKRAIEQIEKELKMALNATN